MFFALTKSSTKHLPITIAKMQGGFSDEVFGQESIQKYIVYYLEKDQQPGGYLPSDKGRTAGSDAFLEAVIREIGVPIEKFADWLTSTHGRHFTDGFSDVPRTIENQVKMIKGELPSIVRNCYIYSHPDHGGTYSSSIVIERQLEEEGVFPSEDKIKVAVRKVEKSRT